MQEVRRYDLWAEGGVGLLEDDGDDVVANVSLPLELLLVGVTEGEQRAHVEHDFTVVEHLVHRVVPGLSVHGVQAALVALVLGQVDPEPQHVEELVHGVGVCSVAEELLLGDLAEPLVDAAELVVVDNHVFVVVDDHLAGARAQDGLVLVDGEVGTQELGQLDGGRGLPHVGVRQQPVHGARGRAEDDADVIALHVALLVVVVLHGEHDGPVLVVDGREVLVVVPNEVGAVTSGRVIYFKFCLDISLLVKYFILMHFFFIK